MPPQQLNGLSQPLPVLARRCCSRLCLIHAALALLIRATRHRARRCALVAAPGWPLALTRPPCLLLRRWLLGLLRACRLALPVLVCRLPLRRLLLLCLLLLLLLHREARVKAVRAQDPQ